MICCLFELLYHSFPPSCCADSIALIVCNKCERNNSLWNLYWEKTYSTSNLTTFDQNILFGKQRWYVIPFEKDFVKMSDELVSHRMNHRGARKNDFIKSASILFKKNLSTSNLTDLSKQLIRQATLIWSFFEKDF